MIVTRRWLPWIAGLALAAFAAIAVRSNRAAGGEAGIVLAALALIACTLFRANAWRFAVIACGITGLVLGRLNLNSPERSWHSFALLALGVASFAVVLASVARRAVVGLRADDGWPDAEMLRELEAIDAPPRRWRLVALGAAMTAAWQSAVVAWPLLTVAWVWPLRQPLVGLVPSMPIFAVGAWVGTSVAFPVALGGLVATGLGAWTPHEFMLGAMIGALLGALGATVLRERRQWIAAHRSEAPGERVRFEIGGLGTRIEHILPSERKPLSAAALLAVAATAGAILSIVMTNEGIASAVVCRSLALVPIAGGLVLLVGLLFAREIGLVLLLTTVLDDTVETCLTGWRTLELATMRAAILAVALLMILRAARRSQVPLAPRWILLAPLIVALVAPIVLRLTGSVEAMWLDQSASGRSLILDFVLDARGWSIAGLALGLAVGTFGRFGLRAALGMWIPTMWTVPLAVGAIAALRTDRTRARALAIGLFGCAGVLELALSFTRFEWPRSGPTPLSMTIGTLVFLAVAVVFHLASRRRGVASPPAA